MNREEFTKLTGVMVSLRYYTERIEPEYMDGTGADKVDFCAMWLKDNKSKVVKALSTDISSMTRDIASFECYKSDVDRLKAEVTEKDRIIQKSDYEINSERQQHTIDIKRLQDTIDRIKADYEEVKTNYEEAKKEYVDLSDIVEDLKEKNTEIVFLKAQLYDLLTANK
jgi:chromosome segregation ATPase